MYDRLGSVRQVIDTSADVKDRYTYDPFGWHSFVMARINYVFAGI